MESTSLSSPKEGRRRPRCGSSTPAAARPGALRRHRTLRRARRGRPTAAAWPSSARWTSSRPTRTRTASHTRRCARSLPSSTRATEKASSTIDAAIFSWPTSTSSRAKRSRHRRSHGATSTAWRRCAGPGRPAGCLRLGHHVNRDRDVASNLWVQDVPSDGVAAGPARRLTRTAGPVNLPSWSPDGQQIAYLGHDREGFRARAPPGCLDC